MAKHFHKLEKTDIDLTTAVSGHSADECIAYKVVNGEPIYLGYYYPKDYCHTRSYVKKYPTIVFIHGGAWESHKIFDNQSYWQGDYLGFLARYYANRGFFCVSIDYRLARKCGQENGYQIIDCYEDCCDAMDYILSCEDTYGIDAQRMYLLGESAGGHLAGALATFHYDRRYAFEKVFLFNAVTHFEDECQARVPKESSHPELASLTLEERKKFLAPLFQLDEKIGAVVLVHGGADTVVPLDHSERFYGRMQELDKKCDLHIIENTQHAFLLAEYVKDLRACKIGINIINSYL